MKGTADCGLGSARLAGPSNIRFIGGNMLGKNGIRFLRVSFETVLLICILCPMTLWAAEGDLKWVFPEEGSVGSITSSPAVGQDGTIYVGSEDGKLYAVNPDGTKKWEFATGGKVTSSPLVYYYDRMIMIYVGSSDTKLYAINADGTRKWTFQTGGSISSSPAGDNLGTIYVGSDDKKIYALRSSDGSSVGGEWPFETAGKVTSSPAVDFEGTVYVGSHDHKVYAITSTGKKKWEFPAQGVVSASPAIYDDGTTRVVCMGSEDGYVYALNIDDGTQLTNWPFHIGSPVACSAALDTTTVYVGADDAGLYAVNLAGGNQSWKFPLANGPIHSCPVIGLDGTLYVGSDDYNLYAIYASTGNKKWSYPTGGKVSSSPTIGFGGDVYVGSEDGRLYAFESSSSRLGDGEWPKFRHDVRNTGRNDQNRIPAANAGTDQTVKSGDTVTLDGSASYDPDFGIPLYSWRQTEGPSMDFSSTAVQPSFKAPGVDEQTVLTFELTVTDNSGKTSSDTVDVTVQKGGDDKGCFISTAGRLMGY